MRLMCRLISISRLRMGKLKSSLDLIWREKVPASERRYVDRPPPETILIIGIDSMYGSDWVVRTSRIGHSWYS